MKLSAVVILFAVSSLTAQTVTLSAFGAVYPGSTVTITATLSGSSGANIGGLQFQLASGLTFTPGAASVAANKTLWSYAATGTNILIGLTPATPQVVTDAAFSDGILGSFPFSIPSSAAVGSLVSVPLTALAGVSTAGALAALTLAPLSLTVGIVPACLTAINANVQALIQSVPSSSAQLAAILVELAAASTTGTCH